MTRWRRAVRIVGVGLAGLVALGATFVLVECSRFDASLDVVYDVPVPGVTGSTDPGVLARGKHVVESVGGCASAKCHGADLGGGEPIEMGPVATLAGPNVTPHGVAVAYTDGEIVRLLRHGLKKDGRSLRFMPVQDFDWLPDSDLVAVASYLHTVPPVDRANGATAIKTLGKILDRREKLVLDVARHIDHAKPDLAPAPTPTPAYGRYVARLCKGCHGEGLSGGPLPGRRRPSPCRSTSPPIRPASRAGRSPTSRA